MTTDSYPLRLYVRQQQTSILVLEPAPDGIPKVLRPAPSIFRTAYLNAPITDEMLGVVYNELVGSKAHLLLFGPSLEGPPFRTAVVFTYSGNESISYRDGSDSKHSKEAVLYLASTQSSDHQWATDARFRQEGYFLTGAPGTSNLWHVERMEIDVANRCIFTLAPVELAAGLPRVKFNAIKDPVLKGEAETHWNEVRRAVSNHSYYPLVTAAKNLAETVLSDHLAVKGMKVPRDLAKMLEKLREMLEAEKAAPYGYLDYHLIHKLRILHGWTHPGAVSQKGRRITPRLALSAVEDLIEMLTSLGLAVSP